MQITRCGSRRVIVCGAGIAMALAVFGKFGGLFASMPNAIVSGLLCAMFGLIAAVGESRARSVAWSGGSQPLACEHRGWPRAQRAMHGTCPKS